LHSSDDECDHAIGDGMLVTAKVEFADYKLGRSVDVFIYRWIMIGLRNR